MTEPINTSKHARDMTTEEYKAKLAELKRGAPPQPAKQSANSERVPNFELPEKHARDMSDAEKSEWLAEHRRKHR